MVPLGPVDHPKLLRSAPLPANFLEFRVGSYVECELVIRLYDSTGSVFSDTTLPISLDLNDFDTRNIEITASSSSELYAINGDITTLSVTVVPLPPAIWLFASAIFRAFSNVNSCLSKSPTFLKANPSMVRQLDVYSPNA